MSTFSQQHTLPSLPVPDLNTTLDRYLQSATATVTDVREIQRIQEIVQDFRINPLTDKLHSLLKERAVKHRNWLEEWWLDSYMTIREPLIPFLSFGAKVEHLTPLANSQLHRASDIIHEWVKFWLLIRQEKIPPFVRQGDVWDMSQYHFLFSSNRTPSVEKDIMNRYFKTEKEGKSPTHIVILYKGQVWKLNVVKGNGTPKTPDELFQAVKYIKNNTVEEKHSVISLTSLNRDDWAEYHHHLLRISATNKENIQIIEESIFCLALIDEIENDYIKLNFNSMLNKTTHQWADKSVCFGIYEDGQATMLVEHSNVDAIVALHAETHSNSHVRREFWQPKKVAFEKPQILKFNYDSDIVNGIEKANKEFEEKKLSLNSHIYEYDGYGAQALKKIGLYPDTVVQIALQLAFAKLHKSFAPIYETASTRKYYHGRTETVRGRTRELVEFGNSVLQSKSKKNQKQLFQKAYSKHNELMKHSMNGEGIDRHLMGLKVIQQIHYPEHPIHPIFKDVSWKDNGGDGNFLLSTSFVGYTSDKPISKSGNFCAAMCPNGYGVFYRIAANKFYFNISNYKNTQSNAEAFESSLAWALNTLFDLLMPSSL